MNNVVLISEPDVNAAICQFIFSYVRPQIAMNNIVQGWTNYDVLPPDNNEFAVFSMSNTGRQMTNLSGFFNEKDFGEIALFQSRIQIDVCSDDSNVARQRSNSVMNIGRSGTGVRFFQQYGISLLNTADGIPVDYVDGAGNTVKRFVNNVNISYYSIITETDVESFDKVKANIRNVDAVYPPKE